MFDEKHDVGDWVLYDGDGFERYIGGIGYVTSVGEIKCTVRMITLFNGDKLKGNVVVRDNHLNWIPANTLCPMVESQYQFLMGEALRTRDFAWCKRLQRHWVEINKPMHLPW